MLHDRAVDRKFVWGWLVIRRCRGEQLLEYVIYDMGIPRRGAVMIIGVRRLEGRIAGLEESVLEYNEI